MVKKHLMALLLAALVAGCATATHEAAPQAQACPADLPSGTRCLSGRDFAGAYYLIAVPQHWNGTLVLHAHGGPTLGAPTLARTEEDLKRWSIVVKAGYAWAGSSFHQGGVAVHAAAEDTERLRRIFVADVAQPRMTILHGQSWGASVAAVGASMYSQRGQRPYDAVLLTSGVLAGGSRAYDFRLDLRVIYQELCGNHPRPDEPQYPLWMGLPVDAKLTPAELHRRVNDCLALDRPADQRTREQQAKVDTIVRTLHIPATSIQSHMTWATFTYRDIAQRTGGRSVFGNLGARYRGSPDDDALNASVARYARDPAALAAFAADTDPDGRIAVPVLTVHAIDDPTAFVEMDDSFLHTMQAAGTADHLVQTFTGHNTHSYLADPVYPTLLAALSAWAQGGPKPTPAQIAQQCEAAQAVYGPGCRFRPDFRPQPLATRVTARQ
jgi:alpha-beta hydrolase superfamily lysophospholipase